jgi:hypothetical protein
MCLAEARSRVSNEVLDRGSELDRKEREVRRLGGQLAQPHRDEDDDRVQNLRVLCCGLLCGASYGALGDSPWNAWMQLSPSVLLPETKQGSHSPLRGSRSLVVLEGCLRLKNNICIN